MSEKVRIYQLAKELNLETKDMLELLDSIGVEYKSHSSTIDEETAETVRQLAEDARSDSGSAAPGDAPAAAPRRTCSRSLHRNHGNSTLHLRLRAGGAGEAQGEPRRAP